MVIATNDSCNTLVSLDVDIKNLDSIASSNGVPQHEFLRTEIYLPTDEFSFDDECEQLYLPLNTRADHYLKNIPQLMDGRDELLACAPRVFNKDSFERIVYVAQGEVGHSLSSQCDILVSDKATTCHILAFRSKLNGNVPLTSLTHIDGASYESCIRAMVGEHVLHHRSSVEEEKKSEDFSISEKIDFEIHVMGGFEDPDSSSLGISAWLMGLLVRIGEEQKDTLKMILRTCAISAMNDNGFECPIGRGLGIDLHSGNVFLAKVEEEAAGPEVCLRSVRLWSGVESRELSVIHSSRCNHVTVFPFEFKSFGQINQLLRLSDEVLVQYTSTSPYVEEPYFCKSIRGSLKYLKEKTCQQVFGPAVNQPLVFQRAGKSNSWTMLR